MMMIVRKQQFPRKLWAGVVLVVALVQKMCGKARTDLWIVQKKEFLGQCPLEGLVVVLVQKMCEKARKTQLSVVAGVDRR